MDYAFDERERMKKPYETPTITTREVLSDVTAQMVPVSGFEETKT